MIKCDTSSYKVSIVLPTYNGTRFLNEAITSCLKQSHGNIELIIVDDGSEEDILSIIEEVDDDRIIFIRHSSNKGLPAALNTGFTTSSGNFLTWISDDNLFDEQALEKMVSFLICSDNDFVFCDYFGFENDDLTKSTLIQLPDSPKLETGNTIGACFMYTRKVQETIGNYSDIFALCEDYDYWIRISKSFKIGHLDFPLYYYRHHDCSGTRSKAMECSIVMILVKLQNGFIDDSIAVSILAQAIAQRFPANRYLRIKTHLCKLLFVKRLKRARITINGFCDGSITAKDARAILLNQLMP